MSPRAGAGGVRVGRTTPLPPRGPAAARALLAPRDPWGPSPTIGVARALGQAAALANVYATFFPIGWARFQIRPCLQGVALARVLGRAIVEEARAAVLFPLLPPGRLDQMDRTLAHTALPFYAWSIPFGGDHCYRAHRHARAGRLERILHALALAPYVGAAAALEDAGLDPAPVNAPEPFARLLALLQWEDDWAGAAACRLTMGDAARIYAWYGSPCPLIPTLVAYMRGETGNPFLDWDEDAFDYDQHVAEEDPFAWDVETVARFAVMFKEASATLERLQPLWAALADARETERIAGAVALALTAGRNP